MDGRGSIKELFPTGKQLEPLVAPLADGKVAVGQDDLTVVLNEEGVCTQKCALNWTDIPIAMGKEDNKLHSQYIQLSILTLVFDIDGNRQRGDKITCCLRLKKKKKTALPQLSLVYLTRFYLTSFGFHITLFTIL